MPLLTSSMKAATLSIEPISVSMRTTASLAPPCSGPYSADAADAAAEYGSAWLEPTTRIAVVPQFCSWSAWRMNSTSIARSSAGWTSYSPTFHIIVRKLAGYDKCVVGEEERQADREAVAHRGQRRRLGDQPQDLLVARLGVVDVLGLGVEGAEGGERRDEHPHRVGVVVEAVDEPLAHVLVDERVVGDLVGPRRSCGRRELAVQEQVGDLEVRRRARRAARSDSRGSAGSRRRRRGR